MPGTPYERFTEEEMILRDHLAMDRTVLANETTLLAYVRTALAVLAAGVSFIHFFDTVAMQVIGWAIVPLGIVTFVVGGIRYRTMDQRISGVRRSPPEAADSPHETT